jgi:Fe-S oxidoreductase
MNKTYFNPGCALSIYKPEAENKILEFLNKNYGKVELHKICCKHDPQLNSGSIIINVCAGCDKRFRTLYDGISTISLWEILDELDGYPYPDYYGLTLSIHDACDVRTKPKVHKAVRNLLKKMNVRVLETKFSGTKSICCGDNFYPMLPIDEVVKKMKNRADSMPCDEICVYCVSCIKAMYIGGKTPRHLIDLLMGDTTEPQIYDTILWHKELQNYIDMH